MPRSAAAAILSLCFAIGLVATATAQAARPRVAPKLGVWTLSGTDAAGTVWTGDLVLEKRYRRAGSLLYRGYFHWLAADGSSAGRETLRGTFRRSDGRLQMKGVDVRSDTGELALGHYVATANDKGRKLTQGRWSGKEVIKGKWSAAWTKPARAH